MFLLKMLMYDLKSNTSFKEWEYYGSSSLTLDIFNDVSYMR